MPLWSSACPSQATALTASLAFLTRGLLTLRRVPEQAADAILIPIVNPVSLLATAVRHLMAGTASGTEVGWVLLASAAITAVFAPLTMRL